MGLLNWWRRRRQRSEQEIFRYWDGVKNRRADPLLVARKIDAHEKFNAARDLPAIVSGDPAALQTTVCAIRDIFGIPAWTETTPGLTEQQTLEVLDHFVEFMEAVKKNSSRSQTSPAPTESPPSAGP